jgi:fatty-acyl-CoA synthase
VAQFSDRRALVTVDGHLTYADLAERVDEDARALVYAGVGKGTRVGLWMENGVDWVALLFAITGLGAVVVPVSTFAVADDLAYQLRHADVAVLVMSARFLRHDYLARLLEVAPELHDAQPGRMGAGAVPALRRVVVLGGEPETVPSGCDRWEDLLAGGHEVPHSVVEGLRREVDPEDDCYLLYTSGTTAHPKGVLHCHRGVARNGALIGDYQGLVPDDVAWTHFPFFFSAGCINVLLGTLSHGAALVVQPSFEAGEALELIERERVTTWHLWPHVLAALRAHPDGDRRDHAAVHKGSGPYDVVLGTRAPDGLGGVNMYGMTETCTAFACTHASDPAQVRTRTHGRLMPGNECKVVDPETGARLGPGEEGELCVRGPSVLRRYHKLDPAGTFDAEGFFHTGDLGSVEADGTVHFRRRLTDVIKTAGVNVSPAAVEAALARIDGVQAAHVFGVPSAERGEEVAAAVVPAPGAHLEEGDVLAWCRDALPAYQRPRAVLVLEAAHLPTTGSGKVRTAALRDLLVARDRTEKTY